MSAIEVRRSDDGSTKTFDASEIGSGAVVSFVTQNDGSADGFVEFLNQAGTSGNTDTPDKSEGKIVEDGSLVTDGNGNAVVKWDGIDDGYEIDISSTDDITSSVEQTVSLKVDPDDLKSKPQTLADSDGLRVWKQDDLIFATISTADPGWRKWQDISGQTEMTGAYFENVISYRGELWGLDGQSTSKAIFWDGSSWVESTTFSGYADAMGIYDGNLYVSIQNGDVFVYDGSSWSQPHTISLDTYYESMVVYDGDLFLSTAQPNTITKYDGNTWEEEFISASNPPSGSDITDPSGPFFHSLCVNEGTLYIPTDSDSPTEVWSYDSTNGLQFHSEVDGSENGSAGDTFNGVWSVGTYKGQLVMGTQSGQFYTYDETNDTWNFQGLACSYPVSFRDYGDDLYMGGDFGFYESDGVWKWDGSTLEKNLDDSEFDSNSYNGPFRFANIWKGKLLTHHRYVSQTFLQKGQGTEIKIPFDQSSDEIVIEAGVSKGTLSLNVNGRIKSTSYDFDYDQNGKLRLGVNVGSVTAGGKSSMDEPYSGNFKMLKHFPKLSSGFFPAALEAASGPNTSTTNVESTSVDGELTFEDPSIAEEYKVLASTTSGGPYETIATFTKTEVGDLPKTVSWTHENLNPDTTYFYVGQVKGRGETFTGSEISAKTAT